MISDRLEHISRIYVGALEVAEEERSSFLEQACQGDVELRREVESLLAYEGKAEGFIDGSAFQISAKNQAAERESLIGRRLGPYQILGALGAGGMGEVYKAKDTRLNRTVAIKVLPHFLSEQADLRQRFEREARTIASLNHPNICALYDVGPNYLVTELVEGETLHDWLKRVPAVERSLEIARQVLEALRAAHRAGIVHRDLKPANVMVRFDGYVKVLDFGLAKRIPARAAPFREHRNDAIRVFRVRFSGRSPTCHRSRSRGTRSTRGATCSRSGSCCTK